MSARGSGYWLLVVAGLVVAATVVAAVLVMGSPAVQRERRMDDTRVNQLMAIEQALRMRHERDGRLPDSLAALQAEPGLGLQLSDPQTGAGYGYRKTGDDAFELCAAFSRDTATDQDMGAMAAYGDLHWRHPAGRHCFGRKIGRTKP